MRFIAPLCIIFLFLLSTDSFAQEGIKHSYEEKGVTVVHVRHAHPFYFAGQDGSPRGLLVDLWNTWSDKTGVPVRFAYATWKDTVPLVLDGTYDIHAGLMISEEREKFLDFSRSLFPITTALIGHKAEQRDLASVLKTASVGAVTGGQTGRILASQHPETRIKEYDTPRQVIIAMVNREVDAIVMDVPSFHFNNIELSTPIDYTILAKLSEQSVHAGVSKEKKALFALVQMGFSQISKEEQEAIQSKWFVVQQEPDTSHRTMWWLGSALIIVILIIAAKIINRQLFRAIGS